MEMKNESCILINDLSVQVETAELNKLINTQIDQLFKSRGPIVISVLNDQEILITPISNADISISNDRIHGYLPVKIETNLRVPVKAVKVEAELMVEFESTLIIKGESNIKVTSSIINIEWTTGPDITPKLVDFIVPDEMVKDIVQDSLPTINEKINETLAEVVNLSSLLTKTVWHKILEIPLKNEESMFLSVKPEYIEIYKVNILENLIKLAINTRVIVKPIESSERPDTKYQPKVTFLESYADNKPLYIEVRLDLQSLDLPALKVVKSLGSIEKAIGCTIEKILVRPVGEDGVAIAMRLKGTLNGGLSIAGNPVVDQQNLMLDIESLTFNFSGKNVLSSLKGNIALSVAKSFMRKQFPIALKPYIDNLISTVNEMMSNLQLANGLFLKGDIHEWQLLKMDIHNGQAIMIVNSNLTMELVPEK